MARPKRKRGLSCCLRCGRDTMSDYCLECIGKPRRGRAVGKELPTDQSPISLEDDYGDESNADSVCDDDHSLSPRKDVRW